MAELTYCSKTKECFVGSYDVTFIRDPVVATSLRVCLVDGCNTLHDVCRIKKILFRAVADYFADNDEVIELCAECGYDNDCPGFAHGDFYKADSCIVLDLVAMGSALTPPVTAVTVTVPLPFTDANVFA